MVCAANHCLYGGRQDKIKTDTMWKLSPEIRFEHGHSDNYRPPRTCIYPLNTHQLTTAHAQREAATGIAHRFVMLPWWSVEAKLGSIQNCQNNGTHLRVMRVQNTSCQLHAETEKCLGANPSLCCGRQREIEADAKDKLSHEHPSHDKLPMNLCHCKQPLNTHQLTTAHAQHEAATDITRRMGMSPWWNVEANPGSARFVATIDVHMSVRSNQKH